MQRMEIKKYARVIEMESWEVLQKTAIQCEAYLYKTSRTWD